MVLTGLQGFIRHFCHWLLQPCVAERRGRKGCLRRARPKLASYDVASQSARRVRYAKQSGIGNDLGHSLILVLHTASLGLSAKEADGKSKYGRRERIIGVLSHYAGGRRKQKIRRLRENKPVKVT